MILQKRDQKLMSMLSKYGLLSTEQIAQTCFAEIAHTTVMRRLRKLELAHFITRQSGLTNGMWAWYLTTEGAKKINSGEPIRYCNRNTVNHEVSLSGLRMILESVGLGDNWTSETEMRRLRGWERGQDSSQIIIPDGLFIAIRNEKPLAIAVELELEAKNHARYKRLFEHYASKDSVGLIWYVTKNEAIGETVIGQWNNARKWRTPPMFAVTLFRDLKANLKEATMYFSDREQLKIHQFFELENLLTPEGEKTDLVTQRVSNETGEIVSNSEFVDSNNNQQLTSDPIIEKPVPSTADHSPPTLR